ncbi:hypothetical protein P4597_19290 [Peribacillus simplex]|nr:hypothetical protein [Peribacillus simplex]
MRHRKGYQAPYTATSEVGQTVQNEAKDNERMKNNETNIKKEVNE